MAVTAQEKLVLHPYVSILVESDEPEAVIGVLQRVAELRARSVRRGKIEWNEAVRWDTLARALEKVQHELRHAVTR